MYAKRRNIKQSDESDKRQKPNEVIGEVLEREYETSETKDSDDKDKDPNNKQGFPKPQPIDVRATEGSKDNSLYSQTAQTKQKSPEASKKALESSQEPGPSDEMHASLHKESLDTLALMSEDEILEEQANLKSSLSPELLDFMKKNRKPSESPEKAAEADPQPATSEPHKDNQPPEPDFVLPKSDFLRQAETKRWMHFGVLEPEKLEWTRDINECVKQLQPGQTYEARFDFYGMLQPYTAEMTEANRHLFMHGGEENRPGLTLQDFFRLARSNNLQQRIAAINAIAGIINIYNKGYYDGVLELPISKIFFLLRFAMDESRPAVFEASSRALAYLFYNDSDEMLLDALYETRNGLIQPILKNKRASVVATTVDEADSELEAVLENLKLNESKKFEINVKDEEERKEDAKSDEEQEMQPVNDVQLAETNLVECLIRTNVLMRIYYTFSRTSPSDITVQSCVKILIRLARSSRDFAFKIMQTEDLVKQMIEKFLPSVEGYRTPHFIILKLFRVLGSYDRTYFMKLEELGAINIAQSYIATRREIDLNLLKVQIESFRLLRLYFYSFAKEERYKEFIEPLSYYLNFHYNRLDFQNEVFFIYRQHASAMIQLISCGNIVATYGPLRKPFQLCFCKWVEMARRHGVHEFSQTLLLSTMFDVGAQFMRFSTESFFEFTDRFFKPFLRSDNFMDIVEKITETSLFFNSTTDRCNIYSPLLNLGSVVRKHEKSPPGHVLPRDYAIALVDSIGNFVNAFDVGSNEKNRTYFNELSELFFEKFNPYMKQFSKNFNRSICTNWFLKPEVNFIYHLLFAKYLQFNDWVLPAALNLISILTNDKTMKIMEIFEKIVFTQRYYDICLVNENEFKNYNFIFQGLVKGKLKDQKPNPVSCAAKFLFPFSYLILRSFTECHQHRLCGQLESNHVGRSMAVFAYDVPIVQRGSWRGEETNR